jgi:uncharacterized protein
VAEVEVEIWPTSIVVPREYRLSLSVRGKDYEYQGTDTGGEVIASFKNRFTGVGPFLHDDPEDRPREIFGGVTRLHFGPERPASILLPVIPGYG